MPYSRYRDTQNSSGVSVERRLYFIFGDMLACAATGAAAAWIVYAAVPMDWQAFWGMIVGMALGMLAGAIGGAIFMPLFGAFEVSLPTGLAGMLAGGIVGMPGARLSPETAILTGAGIGLLCLAYVYLLQAMLTREAD